MAHKKGQGSTSNGRDSIGKRLGVKRYGGQNVKSGEIFKRIGFLLPFERFSF